ncbi:MAG TPA: hypothetical protein VFS43_28905 [Polyangiaceae bacterium]|nr:hypothetical protein [Polyangiaceae bacterium]
MAALTAPRSPSRRGDVAYAHKGVPMAASTTIFRGGMVDKAASGGMFKPAATNTTDKCQGVALETKTNGAVAGATSIQIATGVHNMNNSSAGDQITAADIGNDCFVVDDNTVARTNGGSTRHVAGKVWDVAPDGTVDVLFAVDA